MEVEIEWHEVATIVPDPEKIGYGGGSARSCTTRSEIVRTSSQVVGKDHRHSRQTSVTIVDQGAVMRDVH